MKTLVSYHPNLKRAQFPTSFMNEFFNLDDFFGRDMTQRIGQDNTLNSPNVNIVKSDNGIKLEVAAPGLAKENFNLVVEEDHLIISAEQKEENEEKTENYTRREFNYNSFKRSFRLPENINKDEISASYENGILAVTLPNLKEVEMPETKKTIHIS